MKYGITWRPWLLILYSGLTVLIFLLSNPQWSFSILPIGYLLAKHYWNFELLYQVMPAAGRFPLFDLPPNNVFNKEGMAIIHTSGITPLYHPLLLLVCFYPVFALSV